MTPGSLHIFNARIWTGVADRPWAESITIRNGKVETLHKQATRGPLGIESFDACGRVLAPGLIDAHLHLLVGGRSLERLDLSSVRSRKEFEAAIAAHHASLPSDDWLVSHGWSQENWPGGKLPDKSWLRAAGDRPVVCYRMDMHVALVNDAVLRMCDLRNNPPGGLVERNDRGEPNGIMIEAAAWQLVNPLVPEPGVAKRRQHVRDAVSHLNSLGVTAAGSMEYAADVHNVFAPIRGELSLRCRITLLDRPSANEPMDCAFGASFANDDALRVIGYKTFIDGTLGSRSARMLCEYADDRGNRGMLVEVARAGRLQHWIRDVAEAGLSPSMHAIGDEAVRLALDAIESLPQALTVKIRPRIEHAQQVDLSDVARFRDRIASMQPLHKADDCRYVRRRLGQERLGGTFAFRRLREAGVTLAFGSDWPVVSPDPMLGIRAAVTGLTLDGELFGADQNLTVEEALRAYTAGAAHALHMDDAGALRPGAIGDLVVFDRDPLEADWTNAPPRVAITVVNGNVVYDATKDATSQGGSAIASQVAAR